MTGAFPWKSDFSYRKADPSVFPGNASGEGNASSSRTEPLESDVGLAPRVIAGGGHIRHGLYRLVFRV